jgi:hypothetical protein
MNVPGFRPRVTKATCQRRSEASINWSRAGKGFHRQSLPRPPDGQASFLFDDKDLCFGMIDLDNLEWI